MTRDSQRSKVYRAEAVVTNGATFDTIEEAQDYLDRLIGSAWWSRRWHLDRHPLVLPGHGHRRAVAYSAGRTTMGGTYYSRPTIELPAWARHEGMLLHEFAHVLCQRDTHWRRGSLLLGHDDDLDVARRWADDPANFPPNRMAHGYARPIGCAPHGRLFAATVVALYSHKMGRVAGVELRESFKRNRVRYTRRRRPMSAEQKAAAVANLTGQR